MDFSTLDRIPDLRENWLTVTQKIDDDVKNLKNSLHEEIEGKKINLKPLAAEKKRLANKTHALNEKAKEICHKIHEDLQKDVESCLNDISTNVSLLQENQIALDALRQVISIHSSLEKSNEFLEKKLFHQSWDEITIAQDLIKSRQDLVELTAYTRISTEADNLVKKIKTSMETTWEGCVTLDEVRETKETKLTISVNKSKSTDMREVIQTAYKMDDRSLVEKFLETVRFKILLPQITSESKIQSEENNETAKLIIIIDKSSKAPHYLQAFDRITVALNFIYTHMNVVIPNHGDLFRVMGQSMAEEITEKLMENCLSQVILNQPEHPETLGEIVANAEKLEATLKRMGFLSNDVSLMETDGADLFFTNMIYGLYLEKARNIMKKQTLSSCQLELRSLEGDGFQDACFEQDKEFLEKCTEKLCVNSYCRDILDLVDTIVREINLGKVSHGLRHLYTISNIFEMYGAIVPLYWKKLFDSTPRHVALFHNSCLYFAHVLLCLASNCKNSWPAELCDKYSRFVEQSRDLRILAKNTLKTCVSKKRHEVIFTLKESGLSTIENSPKLDPATENSIRQAIRFLEGFAMAMKDLPDRFYINAMGFLIDEFTETLVSLVCKANDISAVAASELLILCNTVSDRVPKLFTNPLEIVRWCRKWLRFEELKIILGANMETFRDRWASGMGPISNSFSKEEASHLLRALFSNTSARSVLLSEISKYKN